MSTADRHAAPRMGGRPPVIVAGPPRSGTTLVVRLLEQLGLFTGVRRDPNLESYFFLRRNEWVLRRLGGAWDRPGPARERLQQGTDLEDVCTVLERELGSLRFAGFSGLASMVLGRGTRTDARPWGWKDPRNTFTFDAWARLFPEARLILLERNGVDVAQSLLSREQAARQDGESAASRRSEPSGDRLLRWSEPLEPYVVHSHRCGSWEGAFELWEEYAEAGRALYESYAGPKLRVRFETLLAEPLATLEGLAEFCGLAAAEHELRAVSQVMERDRSSSFLRDPALRERYQAVKDTPWMRALGYDRVPIVEQGAEGGG